MKLPSRAFALAALAGWAASGAPAVALAGGDTDRSGEEVVVRGSGGASAGGFSSRGAEDDAAREVTDVASLLEPLPGVHVRRLGGSDAFSTLSIRGSTSSQVAVMFAGVPLSGAADPTLDLGSLPLWPGVKVRVYRSFTPAAVGGGSLGGTLVLEPPRTTDAEGSTAWAGVGSFGQEQLRMSDVRGLMDGRARVVTALSASRATDDFSYYDAAHSTPTTDAYTTRQNAQHAAVSGFSSVAVPLDLGAGIPGSVTLTTLLQSRLQHLPGTVSSPTLFAELRTNRELLSVDVTKPTSERGALRLTGWAKRDEAASSDRPGPLNRGFDLDVSTDDTTVGAGGAAAWRGVPARGLGIDARVDGSFERFAPGADATDAGALALPGATRASFGGGADVTYAPSRAFTVDLSGRLDANVDRVDDLTAGVAKATPSGTDVHPTAHAGAELTLGPMTLAAHGGALARAPSFVERYGGEGVVANLALQPETSLTADAGARYVGKMRSARLAVELDGFATHADQLITLLPEGALGLLKAENVASARLFGLEASVDLRAYGFEWRLAYTGLLTFNDDPNVCVACASRPPLAGRPAHDFVTDVAYGWHGVRIRYGLDAVARLYVDNDGQVRVPDRVLQSAGLRVRVPRVPSLRVALDVSNLFDVRSGLVPGFMGLQARAPLGDQFAYPLPGRSVFATARWSFSGADASE